MAPHNIVWILRASGYTVYLEMEMATSEVTEVSEEVANTRRRKLRSSSTIITTIQEPRLDSREEVEDSRRA